MLDGRVELCAEGLRDVHFEVKILEVLAFELWLLQSHLESWSSGTAGCSNVSKQADSTDSM